MERIKDIIKGFESETYPNGVGSTFRCVKNNNYKKLEEEIKKHVLDQIMMDLYCDIKEIHPKQDIKDWVNKM